MRARYSLGAANLTRRSLPARATSDHWASNADRPAPTSKSYLFRFWSPDSTPPPPKKTGEPAQEGLPLIKRRGKWPRRSARAGDFLLIHGVADMFEQLTRACSAQFARFIQRCSGVVSKNNRPKFLQAADSNRTNHEEGDSIGSCRLSARARRRRAQLAREGTTGSSTDQKAVELGNAGIRIGDGLEGAESPIGPSRRRQASVGGFHRAISAANASARPVREWAFRRLDRMKPVPRLQTMRHLAPLLRELGLVGVALICAELLYLLHSLEPKAVEESVRLAHAQELANELAILTRVGGRLAVGGVALLLVLHGRA